MKVIAASSLPEVDPIDGFRFWSNQPFSRDLLQPLKEEGESNNVKPVSGLWLSPLLNGHTDCWGEFLDTAGWHSYAPHRVEVNPATSVMVLDSVEDIDEYTSSFCTPWETASLIMTFNASKFLSQDIPALYISRNGIRASRRHSQAVNRVWDVPSLWINDPLGIYIQRVEPESASVRSYL